MYGMNQGMMQGMGQMHQACCPQPVAPVAAYGVGAGVGVAVIAVAILILIALGLIF
ncbi:MAG TPA: hypothetical protein VFC84_20355 [Desulfosporosinus sp.]|nr:hypothetical protein [Desulfosporosinus sp.]HZK56516.1 hypothetical protein [Desulfosporosinus sp.]